VLLIVGKGIAEMGNDNVFVGDGRKFKMVNPGRLLCRKRGAE